ncbi:hypothetical protein CC2G_001614 [Coprinopsis cinerea AmutBmut pab1-1]|nr:hypothetical protein CC2G_001614 [Coprinopsis cinerea AmutBmut pab1-1]
MANPTTLDAVLLSRVFSTPDHRVFFRPLQNTVDTEIEPITYAIFDAHVSRLASAWARLTKEVEVPVTKIPNGDDMVHGDNTPASHGASDVQTPSSDSVPLITPRSIVGVYLPSGYTLCVVIFALIRLGAIPFCLSPRNSDEALRHLITKGNVSAVIAANDADEGLAGRMRSVLKEGSLDVRVIDVERKDVQDIPRGPYPSYPPLPHGTVRGRDIALQQHTSGSTAFPKPVPLSHELLLRALQGGTWWVEGLSSQSNIVTGQPPMFHMFGLLGGLLGPIYRGHTFAIPPLPVDDALAGGLVPSPRTLYEYAKKVNAVEIFGVTSAIVGVARLGSKSGGFEAGAEGIEYMKTLQRVVVGGAPIPRDNGDWIVSQGVHLIEGVGSTEGGSLMHSNRPRGDPNWQAMRVCWNVAHEMRPFGLAPGTDIPLYELILHSTKEWGQFPGADPETGKYNTRDLFQEWPHPGSGRYRHFGRSDDVLLLSSGQSWNPRPMELKIEGSPAVRHAVVFGHAKPYLGALIEPKDTTAIDKDGIWAAIEEANAIAPSNARIAKRNVILRTDEGVVYLDRENPKGETNASKVVKKIPIADKGTPLRPKTYALFKEEIDAVYDGVV